MRRIILTLISWYQHTISPDHGVLGASALRCRFFPSCSEYTVQSIQKFGVLKGIGKGFLRIMRCHPFSSGGYDPVSAK